MLRKFIPNWFSWATGTGADSGGGEACVGGAGAGNRGTSAKKKHYKRRISAPESSDNSGKVNLFAFFPTSSCNVFHSTQKIEKFRKS
jgi:hypothetical protein